MSFSQWFQALMSGALGWKLQDAPAGPESSALPTEHRTINAAGLALIKEFESCRLTAYQDQKGVWTIGWGHTGSYPPGVNGLGGQSVGAGDWIPAAVADALLTNDLAAAEAQVAANAPADLTDNQFSALVSWQFNTGGLPAKAPTLKRLLAARDYANVPMALRQWNHVNGQIVPGLTRRREAEVALWLAS